MVNSINTSLLLYQLFITRIFCSLDINYRSYIKFLGLVHFINIAGNNTPMCHCPVHIILCLQIDCTYCKTASFIHNGLWDSFCNTQYIFFNSFLSGFNSTINKIFFALLMAGLANRLPYALYLSFKAEADFVKDHGL